MPGLSAAAGGTTITILGSQFAPGATVSVGEVPAADVQVISSLVILATTPAGPGGPATLTVTVPGHAPVSTTMQYLAQAEPVTACGGPDVDADGVPDDWEAQFGFSAADASDGTIDWDADGRTNAQECQDGTHPRGLFTRYLAEGATGTFFTTRIAIANPGATPARVLLRFQTGVGASTPHVVDVPARARRTVDVETLPGMGSANVSTVIEADAEVVVDRTMRWDRQARAGAHAEASLPSPALRWYLAEGATHGFFDLFYLIQNPSLSTAAQVRIRFLQPSAAPIERDYTVAPGSRFTLAVDGIPELQAVDVSAVIESLNAVPIIVERAMYSSAAGVFAAGHDSAGVTAPASTWFFAEGATGGFFDYFLLLANPGSADATVTAQYLLPSGSPVTRSYTVRANSRRTIYVALEDPRLADTAVSVSLSSTEPVIAERAMWWPSGRPWFEAHNSAGSTTTGTKWALGDGEVGVLPEDTATYILVANTSAAAATVRVTLLFETGLPVTKEFTVNPNSRFNVPVLSDEFPESAGYFRVPRGTRFSAVVESLGASPARIVVERAMYWNAGGVLWAAGSNLLATRLQ
jgi:hypothetical protein